MKNNLRKFHDCLIATVWIKRENVKREIDLCFLFNLISSFQDLINTYKICKAVMTTTCIGAISILLIINSIGKQKLVDYYVIPHGQLQQHVVV
jgi:hypothetical protein